MVALRIASALPLRLGYRCADVLGTVKYRLQRHSMAIRPELHRFLGDEPRRDDIRRRQCRELAYADLEASRTLGRRRGRTLLATRVAGIGQLEAALAGGKGAVLYSLHLCGAYTLVAGLSARGYKLHVFRHSPPAQVDEHAAARAKRRDQEFASAVGCEFLWMEPGNFGVAVTAANALRRNEVVIALIDKPYSDDAVEVDLLGSRTLMAPGHAILARAAGAPLLDVYIHREDRPYPLVIDIGEPHDASRDIPATVRECASRLDTRLRRHPQGWYA